MSFDKSPQQVIVDLANEENNVAVPYNAVTVGEVSEHGTPEEGNTAVLVSAVSGKGYQGDVVLTYSRLDLTELFAQAKPNPITELEIETQVATIGELIPAIAEAYGLSITVDDVVDGPITYENGEASIVIQAAEDSLIFLGSIPANLHAPEAGEVPLADVFKVTVLNGLTYPIMDTSHLVVPVPEAGVPLGASDAESPEIKDSGTHMVLGNNNPSAGFTTSSNDELSLSVTARYKNGDHGTLPTDGVAELSITPPNDWTFPHSLAVLQVPEGYAGNRPLTDLYEIFLSVKSTDTGEKMVLQLVPSEVGYDFYGSFDVNGTVQEIRITDSYVSGDMRVVQNIQRVKFYLPLFPNVPLTAAGVPLGNFEIELTGRRKSSIVPRVTAIAKAHVVDATAGV